MPEELKKMMSGRLGQCEKRATFTKAEGDKDASINLAAAARTMAEIPGAMQSRTSNHRRPGTDACNAV